MKVFIDTNILIDVAARADQYPESVRVINDLIKKEEYSLWLSAISIKYAVHATSLTPIIILSLITPLHSSY